MQKVIIVDDDRQVGACLQKMIPWEELDMQVVGLAYDGSEGFSMALDLSPDIIISDLVMPGMDGSEFCSRITTLTSDVSFIFLSAYEDFQTAQLAMRHHVKDYVLKPIDRSKITYLTDLLRSLSKTKASSNYCQRLLYDESLKNEIISSIRSGKPDYFSDLFCRLANDSAQLVHESGVMRNICLRLVSIFFEALPDTASNSTRKQELLLNINSMHFTMDMLLLTSDLYFGLFNATIHSDDAYYRTLCDQVRAYIEEHFSDPQLDLSMVAAAFNYSPDYLGRMFVKNTGDTVLTLITNCRIQHALFLLTETTLSIRTIAEKVGYVNAGHLTQLIKKRTGMTPIEYRGLYVSGKVDVHD